MDRHGRVLVVLCAFVVVGLLASGTAAATQPEDPDSDVIGWENGYWYNDSIDVDQSDGLSDEELEAYVSRAMARIEVIREREFESSVPVSVMSRSEFANRTGGNASEDYAAWNNQVWKALFVVGADENVQDVIQSTATGATTGAYFFQSNEIVIVTDDPEDAVIDRGTLVHELVHAQQDQYYNLSNSTYRGSTQDEELAVNGLVEGEANYVEALYQERCRDEWECVETPSRSGGGGGGGGDVNRGVLYTLYQPYSDGPPYVHSLVEREGWVAVDQAFVTPPRSTEQVIHHTDEEPVPLNVSDVARNGWEPYPEQGRNGTDTAGEASIFVMLWYQSWEYDADVIDTNTLFQADGPYDTLNYVSTPSSGWGNDQIRPYRKQTATGATEYGYVWTTEWDTVADARQFHAAYRSILRAHDARQIGERTWVIDGEPFADAYRVVREERRVTIVHAPEAGDLVDLRPDLPAVSPTPTASPVGRNGPALGSDAPAHSPEAVPATPIELRGFGLLAAMVALVVTVLAGGWWRRR